MIERVSTHVLDVAGGTPAAGVAALLVGIAGDGAPGPVLGRAITDHDGRIHQLNERPLESGDHCIELDVAEHLSSRHGTLFHPRITVHVRLEDREHYHIAVLVSPFSYTTYLGS